MSSRIPGALLVGLLLIACGGAPRSRGAVRSPTRDYPPPPAETTSGEVVGADRQTPSDKLDSGPRAGSTGVLPAPGGPERETPPKAPPTPCNQIGLEDASGKSKCPPR